MNNFKIKSEHKSIDYDGINLEVREYIPDFDIRQLNLQCFYEDFSKADYTKNLKEIMKVFCPKVKYKTSGRVGDEGHFYLISNPKNIPQEHIERIGSIFYKCPKFEREFGHWYLEFIDEHNRNFSY
ncbi:MAG: hypothetical protein WC679_00580 [Bacteroidales bacterium]|jgi:hypothetical protein